MDPIASAPIRPRSRPTLAFELVEANPNSCHHLHCLASLWPWLSEIIECSICALEVRPLILSKCRPREEEWFTQRQEWELSFIGIPKSCWASSLLSPSLHTLSVVCLSLCLEINLHGGSRWIAVSFLELHTKHSFLADEMFGVNKMQKPSVDDLGQQHWWSKTIQYLRSSTMDWDCDYIAQTALLAKPGICTEGRRKSWWMTRGKANEHASWTSLKMDPQFLCSQTSPITD
jgi:hypothetical protein